MHIRRLSFLTAIVIASLLAASSAWAARDAVITLKDGRTVKGEVVEENDDAVTLLISGIKTPYARDLIKSIEFTKTTEEEYAERRAKVADDAIGDRFQLARWLYDRKAYGLAKKEIDDLAKRDPKNDQVQLLKRIIDEKVKTNPVTPGTTTPGTTTPGTTTPGTTDTTPVPTTTTADLPKDRLDQKQINRIRVLEIDEVNIRPDKVTVPPDVLEKFFAEFADDERVPKGASAKGKVRAQKGLEKLKLIMEVGGRKFFDDIVVHEDPPAIRDFRVIHRNYVLSFCATNDCHGGAKAGKFFLFNTAPTTNETIHTNFYILTQTKTPTAYMVDRDYPSKSLIVQYGLPIDKSNNPHPAVPGFKAPMVTGEKDRTYQMLLEWIGKSLYRPEPKYELNYKLPSLVKPAVPAKDPAKVEPAKADPAKDAAPKGAGS